MLRYKKYILYLMLVFVLWTKTLAQDNPIKVKLQANKKEYICGEPVLLKTSVINTSGNTYVLNKVGYTWGKQNFTMSVAYNGGDFVDIWSLRGGRLSLGFGGYSNAGPTKYDKNYITGSLAGDRRVERMDPIFIPKPGEYKIKSVLKDPYGAETYESEPVSFKVLSLTEKADSISQLGDPNLITLKLGRTIHFTFYAEGEGYSNGTSNDGSVGTEVFEKIAPEIINNHKDSVFREYVMYADIMGHGEQINQYHPLSEKYKQEAYEFVKEYPDSWLLPLLYLRLSDTFIFEKDLEKADEYIDKCLELSPNTSNLRAVKGHEKINIIRQRLQDSSVAQTPTPVPTPPKLKEPLGVALPIAGGSIAVIVISGLILFLRKKKPHKAK